MTPYFTGIKLVTATFTPGTSYAAGNCFGGLLTFNAAPIVANTQVQIRRIIMAGSAAPLTASSTVNFFAFSGAPSTTFTDGSSPTWNALDNVKFLFGIAIINAAVASGQIANAFLGVMTNTGPWLPQTVTTDASGNLNAVIISGGTWTMTTPASFTVTLEIGF